MTSKEAASKVPGDSRPAIESKVRDEIGARLRREHADLIHAPLPSRIGYLLRLLARATAGSKSDR